MKIFHTIDSGGLYGAEVVLLNLMEEQRSMGMEPVLCSIGVHSIKEKAIEINARNRGMEVKAIRMKSGPNVIGAFKILHYAKQCSVDIIHSHGYKTNILLGVIPKSIRKIPLICTVHGWTNTKAMSKMALYEWLDRKLLKYLDAVVVVNRLMIGDSRIVSAKVAKSKMFVVENGIKLEKGRHTNYDKDRVISQYIKSSFSICIVGRLSKEKGHEYLIEAVRLLKDKGNNIKLIIIGEGDLLNELQAKVRHLYLQDHVMFLGYLENATVYIRHFDVFVLSSLTEGMPITLLEAMQENVPIVATNVGGIPDIIGNGEAGLLVPPSDPGALASGIECILENPAIIKPLTDCAASRLKQYYSSEVMAKKYMNIYNILISEVN